MLNLVKSKLEKYRISLECVVSTLNQTFFIPFPKILYLFVHFWISELKK